MPYGSYISSVGGWKVEARSSSGMSVPASSTRTSMPADLSANAAVRPTGPAPTTITSAVTVIVGLVLELAPDAVEVAVALLEQIDQLRVEMRLRIDAVVALGND